MTEWICKQCGEVHDSIPNSFAFDQPYHWSKDLKPPLPEGYFLNLDYCIIDNTYYFIRGIIEIPVHGSEEPFVIGAWTTLSKTSFYREIEMASDPLRVDEPAYFGWFASQIWQYPQTLELKCNVITREPGDRPLIRLDPTDHPLSIEQRDGISQERFHELSAQFIHGWKHPDSGVI